MDKAPWALTHAMGKNESLPAEKYAGLGLFLALESKVLSLCFNIKFPSEHQYTDMQSRNAVNVDWM